MELDCTMYDNVSLNYVSDLHDYPIKIETPVGQLSLNKYGQYHNNKQAKCVIFPKGKTTWEGFVPPCKFKEGDVVISKYGDIHLLRTEDSSYCAYRHSRETKLDHMLTTSITVVRFATEEEKEKLFKAIKDYGYRWNDETKTLETLFKPKFKVGDRVKSIFNNNQYDIIGITDTHYTLEEVENKFKYTEPIIEDKNWELAADKFDINTLVPFESRVLVRMDSGNLWKPAIFGCRLEGMYSPYYTLDGSSWGHCIPYEGNEHLCGTRNDCDEYYKVW